MSKVLLKHGARMTARLIDERTAVHLAASAGSAEVLQEMLRISKIKYETAKADKTSVKKVGLKADAKAEQKTSGETVEDDEVAALLDPDVIDISILAWDYDLPASIFASLSGSTAAVDVLVDAGSSIHKPFHKLPPLAYVLLIEDDEKAASMTRHLLRKGARPTDAVEATIYSGCYSTYSLPEWYYNVFHLFVASGRIALIAAIADECKGNTAVLNSLAFDSISGDAAMASTALTQALASNQVGAAAILVAAGATPDFSQEDWDRLLATLPMQTLFKKYKRVFTAVTDVPIRTFVHPLEASLSACNEGYQLLGGIKLTATRDMFAFGIPMKTLVEQVANLRAELQKDLKLPSATVDTSNRFILPKDPKAEPSFSPEEYLSDWFKWTHHRIGPKPRGPLKYTGNKSQWRNDDLDWLAQ